MNYGVSILAKVWPSFILKNRLDKGMEHSLNARKTEEQLKMENVNEGDFVVMLYDYTHTKKKGQLAKVTGLHLKDVSVVFHDGHKGSYSWYDVAKSGDCEHCICPHCNTVIKPVWCHEGSYFECNEDGCHMAFKEEDYQLNWSRWDYSGKLEKE